MFRRSRKSSAETPQKSNRIFWNIFVNGQKPLKQIFMKSPPLSVLIYLHLPKQPIKLLPPHPLPISHGFQKGYIFLSGNYDCRLVKKVIKPA